MNSDVNEDDEKILNPLKPQKNFGKKSKNKKKSGKNFFDNSCTK